MVIFSLRIKAGLLLCLWTRGLENLIVVPKSPPGISGCECRCEKQFFIDTDMTPKQRSTVESVKGELRHGKVNSEDNITLKRTAE